MKEIFILIEHNGTHIKDISYEMISSAAGLADKTNSSLSAVLLGFKVRELAEKLKKSIPSVLVAEDEKLKSFNSEPYQEVLSKIIKERRPWITFIGHTCLGIDLAPSLAVQLDIPLITNCISLDYKDQSLVATRKTYGGKINSEVIFKENETVLVTQQVGSVKKSEDENQNGKTTFLENFPLKEFNYKKLMGHKDAQIDKIDISQANIIVAVGRAIKEEKNLPLVQELADTLGGVLACSRPIVDKKWLPAERQVGISGKIVKPKLYIAVGISGSFQHCVGMKGSSTIIAVNKDPNAPIFEVAHYGIVDDLFKVVPKLTEKLKKMKVESFKG